MTNQQITDANKMHESGITWDIIAAYFSVTTKTLTKYRKHYENNSKIHGAIATG